MDKLDQEWPALDPQMEFVIRTISDFPNPIDWTVPARNIRIDKQKLRKFLTSKYSSRFASKMIGLFDFSMPLDYRLFCRQVQELVICKQKDVDEIVKYAKHFAFNLYDMNCDGYLDQTDLFSIMRDVKNEENFETALYEDIRDINTMLQLRQTQLDREDKILKIEGQNRRIVALEEFIANRVALLEKREIFLEVFVTQLKEKKQTFLKSETVNSQNLNPNTSKLMKTM